MTAKEIVIKFHNIGDAELSLADTQWLIQNIDKAINEASSKVSQIEPPVKPANGGNLFEMNIYTGRVNGNDIHQKEEQYIKFIAKRKEQLEQLIDMLCKEIRNTDTTNTHNETIAGIIGDANRLSV